MITVNLSDEEARALREVLQAELSDLRAEVAGTDTRAYREFLRARRAAVQRVADLLGPEPTGAPGPERPAA
jgi:hypothetical protein